ncbi:related to nuclease [Desulfotalea psychrophila LSv54]|uniref:Related to nuclease n=1 Tax=Desulfotalea psychrophila (strain LSv54 / DSM 12343) TaxID=177439 RepID=Q6AJV0_DESPS|nr:related to nuclease [Desulfotalea psychrophila LSv54]
MRIIKIVILRIVSYLFLYLFFLPSSLLASSGTVLKIIDGDSLIVRDSSGARIEMRLYGIDSPEWNQKDAFLAKKYLSQSILRKRVSYTVYDYDRYGRAVVLVKRNGRIINEVLVQKGYSWFYPRYCRKKICASWKKLEKEARRKRWGLWKEKNPVSPWRWKHK